MKYYTIHEVTEILGVSAQTLRNWDKSGKRANKAKKMIKQLTEND